MIEGFLITLFLVACVGAGVLLGWAIWGYDMKYYKDLAEEYKKRLESPEVKEAILEKRIKDVMNKIYEKRD